MIELPTQHCEWPNGARVEEVLEKEWLVTNGMGGYASGTVGGINTRRYHGLFVPSLPSPHGRTVLLPRLEEVVKLEGRVHRLDGEERQDGVIESPAGLLRRFDLVGLLPRWEFEIGDVRLQRRLVMVHRESTVFLEWAHLGGPPLTLELRPWPTFRFHDKPVPPHAQRSAVLLDEERVELRQRDGAPPLRMRMVHRELVPFVGHPALSPRQLYRVELHRGLDHLEQLKSPGYFTLQLREGDRAYLAVTIEDWDAVETEPARFFELELQRERRILEHAPEPHRTGVASRLVLAADQFIIDPSVRPADAAWARAAGQDVRSVIAGYHWFTDWGRDTMISLDGLTLQTGRHHSARAILRTFQHYVKDGLLPNLFPEGGREGLYHTADATLWYFHAIDRYVSHTGDQELLGDLFPTLESIVEHHLAGTHFGIHIDPHDGLMAQGEEGLQLTWMDAKVEGWVVTPRRGKAVELNALWFNAMRLMEGWSQRLGRGGGRYAELAAQCERSFNARFWNERTGCLFDVVDAEGGGDDPAVRPNQIFSLSLSHPVLQPDRWEPVLQTVERELLTPVGLRTLSRDHPDYKRAYDGDLRARDAAYHQGTVWPWLLGHFVSAFLRVRGDKAAARRLLRGLQDHLCDSGLGQVNEIFDAEAPHRPRGCMAQAWSVAELLRAWALTCE